MYQTISHKLALKIDDHTNCCTAVRSAGLVIAAFVFVAAQLIFLSTFVIAWPLLIVTLVLTFMIWVPVVIVYVCMSAIAIVMHYMLTIPLKLVLKVVTACALDDTISPLSTLSYNTIIHMAYFMCRPDLLVRGYRDTNTDSCDSCFVGGVDETWDGKKYQCKPFYGKPGEEFELFDADFTAILWDKGDDDSTLEETKEGTDIGGDVWVAAGNGPANAAQTRRRNKRLAELGKLL